MTQTDQTPQHSRRDLLIDAARLAGGAGLLLTIAPAPARATPQTMLAAMKKVIGEAALRKGKVKLWKTERRGQYGCFAEGVPPLPR